MTGSNALIAWCSFVSTQTSSTSPSADLNARWASGRRTPPISTTLRPPSNRAACVTSAADSGADAGDERGVRVAR